MRTGGVSALLSLPVRTDQPKAKMRQTSGYSIAEMSDTHTGSSANLANVYPVLAHLQAMNPQPRMTFFGGDNNVRDWGVDYDIRQYLIDNDWDLPYMLRIGNHDTLKQPGGDEDFAEGEVPHGKIIGAFEYFRGRGWWSWDPPDLDILVIGGLNLVDDADGNYANCNPGVGTDYPRDDWSGFGIDGSEQQRFIIDAVENTTKSWVFFGAHRVMYGPFPATGVGRPTFRAPRTGLLRRIIRGGVSVIPQGDQHYRFVGMKYRSPSDDDTPEGILIRDTRRGVGAIPVVNSGAYATRSVDLSELPGEDEGTHYRYASGTSGDRVASATIFTFHGDSASVSVIECADEGVVTETYSGTIWRNPAGTYRRVGRVQVGGLPKSMGPFIAHIKAAPNLMGEAVALTAPGAIDVTCYRTAITTSGEGDEAVTIGSGVGAIIGQKLLIELADLVEEGDSVTLDHANIETKDGTATTAVAMDDSGEFLLVEWTGAKWRIIYHDATVETA